MKHTILKSFLVLLLVTIAVVSNAASQEMQVRCIAFYNLENLFDTIHDEGKNDYEYLPDGGMKWTAFKYENKIKNMAYAVAQLGTDYDPRGAACVGVTEVENIGCLYDLCAETNSKYGRKYKPILIEGPDRRGVDVALLYDPKVFTFIESESIPFTFEGSSIDFIMTKEQQDYFKTRDILMVHGTIDGEHFAFYVAHLPSRAGGKKGGNQLRDRGGEIMYNHAMQMQAKYPGIKIICMGDMNDNPTDPSMAEYLHGREFKEDVTDADFFSPFTSMLKAGFGSLAYQGVWSIYDLLLVNNALANAPEGTFAIRQLHKKGYYGRIYNPAFLTNQKGQYKGTPFRTFSNGAFIGGYSDHYPTYIVITK